MASFITALALAALVPNVAFAQDPNFTPLASKKFEYTALVRLLPSPSPSFPSSSSLFAYLLPSSLTRPTLVLVNVVYKQATTSATRPLVFYSSYPTPIFSLLCLVP